MQNQSVINKVLIKWGLPVLTALFFAILIQAFFFKSIKYSGENMSASLNEGDYIFIKKTGTIKNDDIVLVNNPLSTNSEELYFKRCIANPGDTVQIKEGNLFVNGQEFKSKAITKNLYRILAFDTLSEFLVTNGFFSENEYFPTGQYFTELSDEQIAQIKNDSDIVYFKKVCIPDGCSNQYIFPYSFQYRWNKDNFGPLIIPKKNQTVYINSISLPLYKQIIMVNEGNDFEEKDGKFFINGKETKYYTFKKNYIFVLNDNRSDQNDSRSWGLIPDDNIQGKATFIWFSKSFKRIFKRL